MRVQRTRTAALSKQPKTQSSKRPKAKATTVRASVTVEGRRAGLSSGAKGMRQLAAALRLLGSNTPSQGAVGMRHLAAALQKLA